MARLTSELAVAQVGNRFDLVLIASIRSRELKKGHMPLVTSKNGPNVTALREIEAGKSHPPLQKWKHSCQTTLLPLTRGL